MEEEFRDEIIDELKNKTDSFDLIPVEGEYEIRFHLK